MISKGIRGAITVEENSPEAIGAARHISTMDHMDVSTHRWIK